MMAGWQCCKNKTTTEHHNLECGSLWITSETDQPGQKKKKKLKRWHGELDKFRMFWNCDVRETKLT